MPTISCPWCNSTLPYAISTQVCTTCGKAICSPIPNTVASPETPEPELEPDLPPKRSLQGGQATLHRILSAFARFFLLLKGLFLSRFKWWGNHQPQKRDTERMAFSLPFTLDQLEDERPLTGSLPDPASEESELAQLRPGGQSTWQKVVVPSPHRQSYIYPPRPQVPEGERVVVQPALTRTHLTLSSSTLQALKQSTVLRIKQTSPRGVFWISSLVLIITVGFVGLASALGFGRSSTTNIDNRLSLQITPYELSVGATMTLHGDYFSPHALVGLTRDNGIPLRDTSNAFSIQTDAGGHFSDTIIVEDSWGVGSHMIRAEDSLQHRVASSPISIDGQGSSLRPPRLHLSVNSLDFGAGDQATNGTQKLTLSNTGSSEISWQATTSQSWLMITPTQGNFTDDSPQLVTVAVDRSKLKIQPDPYSAQVDFSSNGGDESLTVSTQVIPLEQGHAAILQVSPAVLSFTATDGSSTTTSQQIAITDTGAQAMSWHASADQPWLNVSPSSMTVPAGGTTTTQVSIKSRNLLPGTYTATLTFTAQNSVGGGTVFHSPQKVVVSITITPACTLQVSSGMVDFSFAYLQPTPSPKKIDVTASASCSQPLDWQATTNTSWLSLNGTSGTTPGSLSIGINAANLTPNTYTGDITLSSSAGTQTIVVDLIVGPAGAAAISTSPPSLSFQSIAGLTGPGPQTVLLTNTGQGILNWQANAISNLNLNWFQITPSSGTLGANQSTTLTVTVTSSTTLASGNYNGIISLTGNNGAGQSAAGSPLSIPISYVVAAPPVLMTASSSIAINIPGATSSPISLTNAGGSPLNWSATLQSGAPAFVSLSATSGSNLAAGAIASFNVLVNPAGIASGSYSATVIINATNAANGQPISGSPATIPVTITIASPAMQVSSTSIAFSGLTGSTISSQSLTITNSGGGTLSWTASAPTQSWLSISAASGSTAMGTNSTFTFSVQTGSLVAGSYTDQVVITPSAGSPITITITLTLTDPTPTPVATASVTITPTAVYHPNICVCSSY